MSLNYLGPSGKTILAPSTKVSQAMLTLALLTQAADKGVHLIVLAWQLNL